MPDFRIYIAECACVVMDVTSFSDSIEYRE